VLAGCAFQARSAQHTETATIVDDTATELAAGQRTDIAVDSLGLLVPEAFIAGLHLRSYPMITMTDATTWDTLGLGTLIGERYGEVPSTQWGSGRPYAVGLVSSNSDDFTVTYEGEMYLPAGDTTLQLAADDQGFFEIEIGTTHPVLRAHYNDNPLATVTVTPPAAGWYPVRGAMVETYGSAYFQLDTVAGAVATPVTPDQLRTRVTDAHGITVLGSADRILAHPLTATSIEPTFVDQTWNNVAPSYDLNGITNSNHTLRYAGQLRVDTADTYVFSVDDGSDPEHSARLLVDGKLVAGRCPNGIAQATSDPLPLTPGWHDLLADFATYNGVERVSVTVATGSSAAAPIPPEKLRPVRRSGFATYFLAGNTTVASDTSTMIAFPLTAPAGATIDFIDLFLYISGATRSGVQVQLAGTSLSVPATPPYTSVYDFWPERMELAGMPADATYTATITTTETTATVQYPSLIATYHGGPDAPFAKTMSDVSAPHPLAGTVTAARAIGVLDGAQLTLEVRTGDAQSIETAPWVAPETAPSGDVVEYRLTIASDGWQYPQIDRIEIDVTR
jgi:hypothetical protein